MAVDADDHLCRPLSFVLTSPKSKSQVQVNCIPTRVTILSARHE